MKKLNLKSITFGIIIIFLLGLSISIIKYESFKSCFNNIENSDSLYNQLNYIKFNSNDIDKHKLNIAIIDTGLDRTQSCFKAPNVTYVNVSNYSDDYDNLHGSAISGIIINNKITQQIFNNLNFYIIRVGSDKDIPIDNLTKGIEKALELNSDIINISLGTYEDNPLLKKSLEKALSKNIIIVCAAGNDYSKKYLYPASYDGVISVASVDQNGYSLLNNNFNNKICISAPGEKISSKVYMKDGHEIIETGSSSATAITTSVISMMKFINYKLSGNDIKKIFKETASKSEDKLKNYSDYYGLGIINYKKSLMYAKSPIFYHIYEY